MTASTAVLRVSGLEVAYGDVQVLWGIDLSVGAGEIVALVGSNGAGKTTLLRSITGMIRPLRGDVLFQGATLRALSTSRIVQRGIAMVPEGRRLFAGLTVLQNLRMGAFTRSDEGVPADLELVFGLFPRLRERRTQLAGTLSGGEQQMCALGRALMARPRLLLIDELSLGLAPVVVEHLIEAVQRVNREWGTSVLLVDQDVFAVLEISSRGYVLENGAIKMSERSDVLLRDEGIRAAYLGM